MSINKKSGARWKSLPGKMEKQKVVLLLHGFGEETESEREDEIEDSQ